MIPEKRVSSYIIKVSVEAGKVMLLHGYSGAIDVVDISVADLLCEGQTVSEEGMDKALMQSLSKRGYLTDMSKEEENEYFAEWHWHYIKKTSSFTPHSPLLSRTTAISDAHIVLKASCIIARANVLQ